MRILMLVLLVAAFPSALVHASPAGVAVFIAPESQNVDVGDEVVVSLRLDSAGHDVGGGAVFLEFDVTRLTFLQGSVDTSFWNLGFITTQPREAQSGIISFSLGSQTAVHAPDVALASLRFRADADGQARLVYLFNEDAEETAFSELDLVTRLPIVARDASVAIAGPPAMATPTIAPSQTPTATAIATTTPLFTACLGDCNTDFSVTVDEILIMVAVALGASEVSVCASGDANGDGEITVDEILTAVRHALEGCPTTD